MANPTRKGITLPLSLTLPLSVLSSGRASNGPASMVGCSVVSPSSVLPWMVGMFVSVVEPVPGGKVKALVYAYYYKNKNKTTTIRKLYSKFSKKFMDFKYWKNRSVT